MVEVLLVVILWYSRQASHQFNEYVVYILYSHFYTNYFTTFVCTRMFEIYLACYIKPKLLAMATKDSLTVGMMSQCISNDNETPPMQSSSQ